MLRDPWKLLTFAHCRCGEGFKADEFELRKEDRCPTEEVGGNSLLPPGFKKDDWSEEISDPSAWKGLPFGLMQNMTVPHAAALQQPRAVVKATSDPANMDATNGKEDFDLADLGDTAEFGAPTALKQAAPNRVKASHTHPSRARATSDRRGPMEAQNAADVLSDSEDGPGMTCLQWQGRCGFVVRLRPETPKGPWLCHHFALDGAHCVRFGLGKQHANHCAGVLHPINAEDEPLEGLRAPRRCMGLRKPGDGGMGYPLLVRCGRPATAPVCRPDTCPYLAQGLVCPYAARANEASVATASRPAVATDSASITTAPMSDGAMAQPEADSDYSPMHTPRVADGDTQSGFWSFGRLGPLPIPSVLPNVDYTSFISSPTPRQAPSRGVVDQSYDGV